MNYIFEADAIYGKTEDGIIAVKAYYCNKSDGVIDITRVYTNPDFRGQGLAGKLMDVVVDYMRSKNLKAVATCSYASSWLEKNKDTCSDVIECNNDRIPLACKIDGQH